MLTEMRVYLHNSWIKLVTNCEQEEQWWKSTGIERQWGKPANFVQFVLKKRKPQCSLGLPDSYWMSIA